MAFSNLRNAENFDFEKLMWIDSPSTPHEVYPYPPMSNEFHALDAYGANVPTQFDMPSSIYLPEPPPPLNYNVFSTQASILETPLSYILEVMPPISFDMPHLENTPHVTSISPLFELPELPVFEIPTLQTEHISLLMPQNLQAHHLVAAPPEHIITTESIPHDIYAALVPHTYEALTSHETFIILHDVPSLEPAMDYSIFSHEPIHDFSTHHNPDTNDLKIDYTS